MKILSGTIFTFLSFVFLWNIFNVQYHKLYLPNSFTSKIFFVNRFKPNETAFGIVSVNLENNFIYSTVNFSDNTTLIYLNGKMYSEKIINDTTYKVCVDSFDVPPLAELFSTLNLAIRLDNIPTFDQDVNKCSGNRWLVSYAGQHYVICQNKFSGKISGIIGENLLLEVLSLSPIPEFQPHFPPDFNLSSCNINENVYPLSSATVWDQANLWYSKGEQLCLESSSLNRQDASVCTSTSSDNIIALAKKNLYDCVFIHGIGVDLLANETQLLDTFPEYWGDVHLHTPQCKTRKFLKIGTMTRGWNDNVLQKEVCSFATKDDNSKTDSSAGIPLIKNKIIFAHSMGNLILAGAIKNKICDVDIETVAWYSIMSPYRGSKAADMLEDLCKSNSLLTYPMRYIADFGGYCVPGKNVSYPAYSSLTSKTLNATLSKELQDIAKKRISGALCGSSPYGLQSRYGLALTTLAAYVRYSEENDGMVEFSSCNLGIPEKFVADYEENWYYGQLNHADGTARNNDGWWGKNRMVLPYFRRLSGKPEF